MQSDCCCCNLQHSTACKFLFYLLNFLLGCTNNLHIWVRDHRQHHKYSDTDADPHNSTRGFFFSHCGWLMMRKHPGVIAKGKSIDLSDLEADPIVMFHKKYYLLLYSTANILISALPCLLWGESMQVSVLGLYVFRSVLLYNVTWLVNVQPTSTVPDLITGGEGWHNFHHIFPSDYRALEFGHRNNFSTKFLEAFRRKGSAYDVKET